MTEKRITKTVRDLHECERGAVAVEYVLIATAMFLALVPSIYYVSSGMSQTFSSIGGYFSGF